MLRVGEEIVGLDLPYLTTINDRKFAMKLLILVLLYAVFIPLVALASGIVMAAAIIILGLLYAHAVELQHQCLHNTAFRKSKWNRFVGVLLGVPALVSYSDYQASHFKHHKLLGTPEDREFFNYNYDSLTSLKTFIPHLFMLHHYRDVAANLVKAFIGFTRADVPPRTSKQIRVEYLIMSGFLVMMAVVTIVFQTPIFLKIWVLPLLITIPTHALIELPEHIGCNNQTTDVLNNTRTIKAGILGTWFTDGNNYHVEHHWLPGVPNEKLHHLNRELGSKIVYLESSYPAFYLNLLKQLYHNKLQVPKQAAKGAQK
jgi:fatty acid desaturase